MQSELRLEMSALKVGNDHDLEEKRNSLLILQIKM